MDCFFQLLYSQSFSTPKHNRYCFSLNCIFRNNIFLLGEEKKPLELPNSSITSEDEMNHHVIETSCQDNFTTILLSMKIDVSAVLRVLHYVQLMCFPSLTDLLLLMKKTARTANFAFLLVQSSLLILYQCR